MKKRIQCEIERRLLNDKKHNWNHRRFVLGLRNPRIIRLKNKKPLKGYSWAFFNKDSFGEEMGKLWTRYIEDGVDNLCKAKFLDDYQSEIKDYSENMKVSPQLAFEKLWENPNIKET